MEDYNSENENNNGEVKMEVDTPDYSVNCKTENGDCHSPLAPASTSSDVEKAASNDGERNGEKNVDKIDIDSTTTTTTTTPTTTATTNGPASVYYQVPSLTKRNVTLQMLLAAGILKPGEGTMSLEYHQQKFVGDLLENGQIRSQETSQIFSSPSAWALQMKKIINPEKVLRKSGCGWASIKYRSLKLDYYKTVWFKRVREGSIDIRNISNGTASSDDDDDDAPHCVLKYGEHLDTSSAYQSAILSGSKVFISCAEFKELDRLQPFHVKITAQACALADFHCNITNTECLGYISGHWNGDQNVLKLEVIHPVRVLMPHSAHSDCDNERNRIALEIQRLGHEVVGWFHSHPKAPAEPSKDDISRQLDYQIMMKGATEASYIPCVGLIISPMCFANQDGLKKSRVQLFWVMPPAENRPTDLGRPMKLKYDIIPATNLDTKSLILEMGAILNFYKERKSLVDITDLSTVRFDKLKETISSWIPELKDNQDFWIDIRHLFTSPVQPPRIFSPVKSAPVITHNSTTHNNTTESPAKEVKEENSPPQQNDTNNTNESPENPSSDTAEPTSTHTNSTGGAGGGGDLEEEEEEEEEAPTTK